MERPNAITLKGNPLTLVGPELKVGDKAPDFTLIDNGFAKVKLSEAGDMPKLISVVPSLDTGVCSLMTKTFHEKLAGLTDKAQAYTVSVDLPFAQGRFCGAESIEKMQVLSDHREVKFGTEYGVLIKEMRLLARSVFVLDKDNTITYVQIVPEFVDQPDFDAALEALKKVIG